MLDLTSNSNGNPVRLQEISDRQNISLHYLEQLFRKLRNGQAVKSVRGPGGGYVLSRSMDQISIKDILECVGENIDPARDIVGSEANTSSSVEFYLSKNYFSNLALIMREYLQTTTLGDLMRKAKDIKIQDVRPVQVPAEMITNTSLDSPNLEEAIPESMIRSSIGEINQ